MTSNNICYYSSRENCPSFSALFALRSLKRIDTIENINLAVWSTSSIGSRVCNDCIRCSYALWMRTSWPRPLYCPRSELEKIYSTTPTGSVPRYPCFSWCTWASTFSSSPSWSGTLPPAHSDFGSPLPFVLLSCSSQESFSRAPNWLWTTALIIQWTLLFRSLSHSSCVPESPSSSCPSSNSPAGFDRRQLISSASPAFLVLRKGRTSFSHYVWP